ncbi:MAG: AAA family ATPase, partial [Deltaproteobacteria bacterium]|nr:AAA family ATPase [Deltaproteobacteria bacterium]
MAEHEKSPGETVACFGSYRLDREHIQLWRGAQEVKLTGKAFAVLRYFVAHPGQLVTKDDLFAAAWPETVVSDATLASCIQEVRQALRENAKKPRYLETVHRRGYRFIAPLTPAPPVPGSRFQVPSSSAKDKIQQLGTWNVRLETPLVGRETELAQLYGWLDKAAMGERQVVFVTGEAGIGKTALVDTFVAHLGARGDAPGEEEAVRLGRGQCIEHYGAGEPYLPLLEALGRLCREAGGKQLIEVLHQHAPTWLVQMPALLNATELEALHRKVAGATKERMLRELTEAVEVLTAERPLVLWVEDLQWCDHSTLDWLAFVARRRERARLLVLGSYRPVETIVREHPLRAVKQELQVHGQCAELALGLLSEAAVGEYLAARFAGGVRDRVPLQRLARTIHRRTDGNPLFMVNVADHLLSQGALVQADGQWTLKREGEATATVPENLQQMIEQRLAQVNPTARLILEVASVAGVEFSAAAVAVGAEMVLEAVEEHCAELARREQFLRTSGTSEWPDRTVATRYSFQHALYQEVLYERLSAGRRRQVHQRIGEREEQAYGERAREIAAELAVHFEQGRDYRRAVQYLQQAGENATQRSAHVETISHLTKALELLKAFPDTPERLPQELGLQLPLIAPLSATKGYGAPEVERVCARALELCRQIGETSRLFPVLLRMQAVHLARAEFQKACSLGEQCLILAQQTQDPVRLVSSHYVLGVTLLHLGEFAPARAHLEQGIALHDCYRDRVDFRSDLLQDEGVSCRSHAAVALWYLGYPDQAVNRSYEALTLAQEQSNPYGLVYKLSLTVMVHQLRGEGQRGQEQAERAIALCHEQGIPLYLAMAMILWGWALTEQGQEEEGIARIRQGLAAWRATGAEILLSHWLALLAEAYGKV